MKDEELNLEEIEDFHTLGGVGRYYTSEGGDGDGLGSKFYLCCHTHLNTSV